MPPSPRGLNYFCKRENPILTLSEKSAVRKTCVLKKSRKRAEVFLPHIRFWRQKQSSPLSQQNMVDIMTYKKMKVQASGNFACQREQLQVVACNLYLRTARLRSSAGKPCLPHQNNSLGFKRAAPGYLLLRPDAHHRLLVLIRNSAMRAKRMVSIVPASRPCSLSVSRKRSKLQKLSSP